VRENTDITSSRSYRDILFTVVPYILIVVILIILPIVVPVYLRTILTKIYIFAIFAMGLNLFMGYVGLVSLGHAVFFGVGGYMVGILALRAGIDNIWIAIPAALFFSAIVAAFIGFIALRVSGMHLIIISIAFGQLFFAMAVVWRSMTGSTDGLMGIPFPALHLFQWHWTAVSYHYFILAVFVFCYIILYFITHSSFGYALIGIRENEQRMQGLGYNTWMYKYLAFILSGVIAGLAGALYAPAYQIMVPTDFALLTSATAVLMMTLGSAGTLYGPVIGSALITFIYFFASTYVPERWPLILGAIFVVCISLFRGGVGIYIAKAWGKLRNASWKY
jgi:branched-chain amino acid transport system permease protein